MERKSGKSKTTQSLLSGLPVTIDAYATPWRPGCEVNFNFTKRMISPNVSILPYTNLSITHLNCFPVLAAAATANAAIHKMLASASSQKN